MVVPDQDPSLVVPDQDPSLAVPDQDPSSVVPDQDPSLVVPDQDPSSVVPDQDRLQPLVEYQSGSRYQPPRLSFRMSLLPTPHYLALPCSPLIPGR